MIKSLLLIAILVTPSGIVFGQGAPVPPWADSALTKTGFWRGYDYTSRLNPEVAYGDLDGDGL